MAGRRSVALAASVAMGLVTSVSAEGLADSDSVTIALEYSVASGCPDPSVFETTVENRLGHEVFATDAPSRVLVRITSDGDARSERRGGW